MEHLSQETLKQQLDAASKKVKIGSLYSHLKHPDKLYRISELAVIEATEEICVIYQAQYGAKLTFVRPLSNWLEVVQKDGVEIPRFKEVTE